MARPRKGGIPQGQFCPYLPARIYVSVGVIDTLPNYVRMKDRPAAGAEQDNHETPPDFDEAYANMDENVPF